jgi:hypothetical protein
MKKISVILIIVTLALSACKKQEEPTTGALDLTGQWDAYGYRCINDNEKEVLQVYQEKDGGIYAIKLIGDPCVTKGTISWIGRLSEDKTSINGQVSLGNPSVTNLEPSCKVTIEIISPDMMYAKEYSITMVRRQSAYKP